MNKIDLKKEIDRLKNEYFEYITPFVEERDKALKDLDEWYSISLKYGFYNNEIDNIYVKKQYEIHEKYNDKITNKLVEIYKKLEKFEKVEMKKNIDLFTVKI
jgi:hypothetical protein